MKIKLEVDVSDTYTKGCCYDCPFSYQKEYDDDGYTEYEDYCVLGCKYDECPVEIVK